MKLYTEEQVREAYLSGMYVTVSFEEMLQRLSPIELPTDEEIEKEASNFEKKYRTTTYEKSAHVIGAKWMRDKIQGGNQ